jgi:hypothetical protein
MGGASQMKDFSRMKDFGRIKDSGHLNDFGQIAAPATTGLTSRRD